MTDPKKLIEEVWELTRSGEYFQDRRYWRALVYLGWVPKVVWFRQPFYVPQSEGRKRLIVPAEEDLGFVQETLAAWMVKNFSLVDDGSWLGVLKTVEKHHWSNYALVVDLKEAFNHVTVDMIRHWLGFYLPEVPEEVINYIVDLLTWRGRAPQGCVSTWIVYDFVVRACYEELERLRKEFKFDALTLYVDDLCFSAKKPFDISALKEHVSRIVVKHGFEVGRTQSFPNKPIVYLGTQISEGQLSLASGKYNEFCDRLREAVAHPAPKIYHKQILGVYAWARHICGKKIPEDLLELFEAYFTKVGMPRSLSQLLAEVQQYPLWPEEN